jgi:citrate/tricarballylate utilization protein
MVAIFGAAFLYAIVASAMGMRRFWTEMPDTPGRILDGPALSAAGSDAATLRYLDGGGPGCATEGDTQNDNRRIYHHLTAYGFLLCVASTSVATVWHYAFGWIAPYPWWDLPVVLGTLGGIGIVVGPIGLLAERRRRDRPTRDGGSRGMDVGFLVMLLLTGATGLVLLVLRETAAMGMLLAIHLGFVFALFLTMPYGKFVHGLYRYLALVRYAQEKRQLAA